MDLRLIIDFFVHLDHHIAVIVDQFGSLTYLILFMIVFCETGLVFLPFLPGDSLLFVLGAFAANGSLDLKSLWFLLALAAITGDAVNYAFGRFLAPKIFNHERIRFLKPEYLKKTEAFFEKHGNKAIVLARFIPIIRTFAPFLAGVGHMPYKKFALYNIAGGIIWVSIGLVAGYFFGNLPFVAKNFSLVILGIIILSIIPAIMEYLKHRR